jgi:serine/threonine protein kinase
MPYDPMKSDVWSIGITLYYLVVGFLPFIDKDLKTLYQKIVSNKLHFPSFLSPQLASLLSSMLGSNPAQRPSLATLLNSPLMPPISFPSPPILDTPDHDILKTVSRQCKISESFIQDYLKNKNKNAFTAQ